MSQSQSQSEACSDESQTFSSGCINDEEQSPLLSEQSISIFEEVSVGNEIFCLVPKSLIKYVPTIPVEVQHLKGIGQVEVGNDYLSLSKDQLTDLQQSIDNNTDLQEEVARSRTFLWSQYGKKMNCHHLSQA